MPAPKSEKTKKPKSLADIELHPDAWDRFERFVKTSVPNRKPTASRPKPAIKKARKKV